ncbi:hypothetical protein Golob_022228 [Gossypium lobatum]|uniref:Uncharacterized protein n=1 Tax=Gossypium lobatum TaxID=34289 RepID=A0A7J8LG31_9ROSI|nr:hypothetical protein [Gossypium lobatum]
MSILNSFLQCLGTSDCWRSLSVEKKVLEMVLSAMEWMTEMTFTCALGLAPLLVLIILYMKVESIS